MPPVTIIASRAPRFPVIAARDGIGVVAHDAVELDAMARGLAHLLDEAAALVVVKRASVARGQHADFQIGARVGLCSCTPTALNTYITEALR